VRETSTNGTPPRWLTQQGVADYVGGCSVRQVQILTRQGRLPVSYALGPRLPRYDRLAIDRAMAEQAAECEQQQTSNGEH
jgi:phage terminase Nu1 subunit (DNA packaging protein)